MLDNAFDALAPQGGGKAFGLCGRPLFDLAGCESGTANT
ncbi:hypothetical protein HRUBRA_01718 [Pseudohaliea rubra DSM 19751]|uniref:Uncharacterized protein n=1 Tax=Pseudohaliea rubra DSM 19751 TaxID=1265313 RepID=A0A095XVI8_9GAMM|nr:hypothetical protein HRUBRA_01718 [Pseudohaliea rubra DSM 19751]